MKKILFNLVALSSLALVSCQNKTTAVLTTPETTLAPLSENSTNVTNETSNNTNTSTDTDNTQDKYIYNTDHFYTFHEERHEDKHYDDYGHYLGSDVWYTRWYTFEPHDITDNTYRGKEVILKDKIEWTNPETQETELLEVKGIDGKKMTIQNNDYIERIICGDKTTQYWHNKFTLYGIKDMPNLIDVKGWIYMTNLLASDTLDNIPNLAVPLRLLGGIPRLFGSPKVHTFVTDPDGRGDVLPANNQNGSNKMTEELRFRDFKTIEEKYKIFTCGKNGTRKLYVFHQNPTPEELEKYNLWHWRDSDGEPEKW